MIASTSLPAPSAPAACLEASRRAVPIVPFTRISVRTLIWSILLGVGVVCPLTIGVGFLDLPHHPKLAELGQQRWLGYALHPGPLFLRAVLIVPLLEEIFYRGIVLQLLRRYCPRWLAVFVSAAFFGVTHLGNSPTNAVFAFVIGGLLAWLLIRTRSLFAAVVCHASINFAWLFLLTPAFGIMEKTLALDPMRPPAVNPLADIFPAWWLVVSLVLVTCAVVMIVKPAPQKSART